MRRSRHHRPARWLDRLDSLRKQVDERARLGVVILGVWTGSVFGQFHVEVAGVGKTQIPVAVANFRMQEAAPHDISAIVLKDLERSGLFRRVDGAGADLDESSRPNLTPLRAGGAEALALGSVRKLTDGRFDLRFRLWDVVRAQDLGGRSYAVVHGDLRLGAHRIADDVYEKLTGEKGVFATRIAYVTKDAGKYTLWVADADGENARSALASAAPIISPSWSADGTKLAYVSFESRKPVVYVQEIASGKRRLIANFRGSNSAPAWAPDGKTLAVTLTRDGGSQLYTISAQGGAAHRLTQSAGIDTEPVYSPDGRNIYFVSDRAGSPQIYRMPAAGGAPERVTLTGSYNISPALSPDGRVLAYVSRVNGQFRLHAMNLETGSVQALTDTAADEQPSFAPNGRLLIYATRIGEVECLVTTTLDGKTKTVLAGKPGDIREPDWGPFSH